MEHDLLYELFIVNCSNRVQQMIFLKKSRIFQRRKTSYSSGDLKNLQNPYTKPKNNSKIILRSKLPLARPIVFKYMKSSFDVFHG